MKKFLILQLRPEDETSDNEYEAFLKFGGLKAEETERIRIEKNGIPELNLDNYSAIIVGGSPFDISTPEDKKSAVQKKIEADFKKLFDEVIGRDFPFLGACSGNGLLGNYCGATISKKYGEAVGGVDIILTEEGKKDQLLVGLPETFRVLVGHKEACDSTPKGAVLLASSATCPVEMFRVKNNVYATQFHPEGDAEGFTVRINIYKHHGYFPAEDAEKLIEAVEKEDTPHAQEILRRFVEIFRK
ncbi:MAG: glutamine amidotransferase [Candidatus Nomurabacteria bacterium]|nr:glutamine amidotransferase [Candidatus Nomurabacteria bacterium]USN87739.1 MAG: glutamine amidotransferase [Candidatus Nomurabacteria bacterium]